MDDTERESSGGLMVMAVTILKLKLNEPRFFPNASAKRDTVATSVQSFPLPHNFLLKMIKCGLFFAENRPKTARG